MKRQKLKIAFVSFYSGSVNRGVESFVHELAKRLSEKHEVTVFQSTTSKVKHPYTVISKPVHINWNKKDMKGTIARRLFLDYWSRMIAWFTVRTIPDLWSGKYDIVFALNGGWQSVFIRLVTWLRGAKMVVAGQSGTGWDDRINMYCLPDRFVVFSTTQLQWAQKTMRFVKSVVIPNGVDTGLFKSRNRKERKIPRVLCVSALDTGKRIDLAIKALAGMNVEFVIVGDGPRRHELEKLIQRCMPKRAKIITVDYENMPTVYKDADLFTFPTVPWESFGIVLLEAMASGLPVVATDDPIRREIVGDAGIFVDPTDTDAYAKAIKKALNTKWGNKPATQAKKFEWTVIAQKYDELFQEITK